MPEIATSHIQHTRIPITMVIVYIIDIIVFLLSLIHISLPAIWGVTGVWLAIPVAEFVTLFLSIFYQRRQRTVYHLSLIHILFPLSAIFFMRIRFSDKNAVSVAEKYADMISHIAIMIKNNESLPIKK